MKLSLEKNKSLILAVLFALIVGGQSLHVHGHALKDPVHECSHHLVQQAAENGSVVDTSGNLNGRVLQSTDWHKIRIKIDYSRKKYHARPLLLSV